MAYEVVFAPEAREDLLQIYDYIAARSGPARARVYADRIFAYCLGFETFPERGTRRDDLCPGLRVVGFARRVTIAFHISGGTVPLNRKYPIAELLDACRSYPAPATRAASPSNM